MNLHKLAKGGFGAIYQHYSNKKTIFKVNQIDQDSNNQIISLRNEIAAYNKINDLQGICQMKSSRDNNTVYIELERFDLDLSKYITIIGVTDDEAIVMSIRLIQVIEQIHKLGVIHCDIKPQNILIQYSSDVIEDRVKLRIALCDFGLGQIGIREKHSLKGTDTFIDPSIQILQKLTFACDIWSIGITLLKLINPMVKLDFLRNKHIKVLKKNTNAMQSIQTKIDHLVSLVTNKMLQQIIKLCLVVDAQIRPTASEILSKQSSMITQHQSKFQSIWATICNAKDSESFGCIQDYKCLRYIHSQDSHYIINIDDQFIFIDDIPFKQVIAIDLEQQLLYHNNQVFLKQLMPTISDLLTTKKLTKKLKMKQFKFFEVVSFIVSDIQKHQIIQVAIKHINGVTMNYIITNGLTGFLINPKLLVVYIDDSAVIINIADEKLDLSTELLDFVKIVKQFAIAS